MASMRALVDAAGAVEPSITDESGLVAAFRAGVAGIRRIVLDAARELGIAIGWLIGVLNVRHVLLVGPVAAFGDDWLGEVRRSARSSVLALLARDTQIEFGHVHDDVVVLGASALLMEQQLGPGVGAMIATHEPGSTGRWSPASTSAAPRRSIVVTDDRDRVLYEHVAPTDRSSLVGQIAGLVDDARRQLGQDVAAVGVAIPGHVDPEDGSVSMAVNLGITHLPLGPMLQAELGVPVFVEHDARAAALWLSEQAADGSGRGAGERRLPGDRDRHLGRHRSRRGPAPRRQQLCRRGGPRRRRSGWSRLRVRSARLPRDDRRRSGDRSPGRRGDGCRSQHRPVAAFERRRRLPRQRPPATRSRSRSSTAWPTTWPGRSDRSP